MAKNKAPGAPKAFNLSTLPKRRTASTDLAAANAWLGMVTENGAATDGTSYSKDTDARNAGLRVARLLEHVAPADMRPSIRTFGIGKDGEPTADDPAGYGFAVTLKPIKEDDDEDEAE